MSKAFTKDDVPDSAPIQRHRPPLPPGVPNYVTPRGLQALRVELAELEPTPSPVAGDETSTADRQAIAARRLELEERIATAVIAPAPANRNEARFGALVRLSGAAGQRELEIVGVDEANPAAHLIAFTAPLARALLGRQAGEEITVRSPGGEEEIRIEEITYPQDETARS